MRIRTIKPEFWRSEDIAALSRDDRLLFIGLWSYVDDNGVGRDNERLIMADLFPLEEDPRDTLATVSRGLQHLSERGLITRYEADGVRYVHVTTWDRHQKVDRPNKARYPLPTSGNETPAKPSRQSRETTSSGTGEQGNRGTGEKTSSSEAQAPRTKKPAKPQTRGEENAHGLCAVLADAIASNGVKRPTITKGWLDAARLLVDRDGHEPQDIARIARWVQDDSFWHSNVLSMPKLREQYDRLWLRSKGGTAEHETPRDATSTTDRRVQASADLAARLRAQEQAEQLQIGAAS